MQQHGQMSQIQGWIKEASHNSGYCLSLLILKFRYRPNWVREVRLVLTSAGVFTKRRPSQGSF